MNIYIKAFIIIIAFVVAALSALWLLLNYQWIFFAGLALAMLFVFYMMIVDELENN